MDMIGTTVEAGPEVSESFREAFARAGVALTEAAVDGVRGRSKREAVADLVRSHLPALEAPGDVGDDIYASFRALLLERYETGSRPVLGSRLVLEELEARGIRVVLTTGLDRETAARIIHGLGWEDLPLGGVLTGDDVERGRPAPDLIHAAMALVGETDPGAVLAVGDTVSDLEAAARAGTGWGVGVLSGAHSRAQLESRPHAAILDSIAELPGWLDENGLLD
jgi:phosphonatase-like hydrolase